MNSTEISTWHRIENWSFYHNRKIRDRFEKYELLQNNEFSMKITMIILKKQILRFVEIPWHGQNCIKTAPLKILRWAKLDGLFCKGLLMLYYWNSMRGVKFLFWTSERRKSAALLSIIQSEFQVYQDIRF